MSDAEKLQEIRAVIRDALAVYPGDDAISLIHKILDIINDQP